MPYSSDAQRKYFNANRVKLEAEGVDVDEWNASSKGKKLPEKVKEKKSFDLGSSISNFKLTPIGTAAVDLAHRMKSGRDVAALAQEVVKQARCWEGYEPVPGKEPYSEDSCRPKGSGKKKEKKAESCGCGGPKDACTCDS